MHTHEDYIRQAIDVAKTARANGNLPYGCILVNELGEVIEKGENSIHTDRDSIAHAEIVLIHKLAGRYSREQLSKYTIYTTDEPCPMCASAIFWSGIGKLIYGLRKSRYYEEFGRGDQEFVLEIPCQEILKHGGRKVIVEGPVLEGEAVKLHY